MSVLMGFVFIGGSGNGMGKIGLQRRGNRWVCLKGKKGEMCEGWDEDEDGGLG